MTKILFFPITDIASKKYDNNAEIAKKKGIFSRLSMRLTSSLLFNLKKIREYTDSADDCEAMRQSIKTTFDVLVQLDNFHLLAKTNTGKIINLTFNKQDFKTPNTPLLESKKFGLTKKCHEMLAEISECYQCNVSEAAKMCIVIMTAIITLEEQDNAQFFILNKAEKSTLEMTPFGLLKMKPSNKEITINLESKVEQERHLLELQQKAN